MPNHVRNIIKIKVNNPKEFRDKFATALENCIEEYCIDFNKIIPEPKTKEDCPEKYIVTDKSNIQSMENKPWFNWYDWNIDHWDTKWNAYDGYTKMEADSITFVFSTAWSAPMAIYYKLSLEGVDSMEVSYADEDIGNNCGKLIYTSDEGIWKKEDIEDTVQFAEEVWDE